jgi:hypothetical protein
MGVVIGVWIAVVVVTIVGIGLTNPPTGLVEQAEGPVGTLISPPADTTTDTTAAEETNLFTELETAEEAPPAAPEGTPPATPEAAAPAAPEPATPPVGGDAGERTDQDKMQAEQIRMVQEWLGRAWPILLILFLLFVAVSVWLLGAQTGYLAKRVMTQQSSLGEFWAAGARAFWPLLGAWGLILLALGAIGLVVWGVAALSAAMPGWLLTILLVILWIGLMWLAIRLAFWLIAVVVDHVGPLGGLRASLRATRGHWWRLFGLLAIWLLIGFGVQLPLELLQELGNVAGGALALVAGLTGAVVGGIANVYLGFASLAAFIRFYEDTKPAPVSTGP